MLNLKIVGSKCWKKCFDLGKVLHISCFLNKFWLLVNLAVICNYDHNNAFKISLELNSTPDDNINRFKLFWHQYRCGFPLLFSRIYFKFPIQSVALEFLSGLQMLTFPQLFEISLKLASYCHLLAMLYSCLELNLTELCVDCFWLDGNKIAVLPICDLKPDQD